MTLEPLLGSTALYRGGLVLAELTNGPIHPNTYHHTAGYDLFIEMSTCLAPSILGPDVVQIWSLSNPESVPDETFLLHRAETLNQDSTFQTMSTNSHTLGARNPKP